MCGQCMLIVGCMSTTNICLRLSLLSSAHYGPVFGSLKYHTHTLDMCLTPALLFFAMAVWRRRSSRRHRQVPVVVRVVLLLMGQLLCLVLQRLPQRLLPPQRLCWGD